MKKLANLYTGGAFVAGFAAGFGFAGLTKLGGEAAVKVRALIGLK